MIEYVLDVRLSIYLLSLECGVDDEYHLRFDCEAISGIREEYDMSVNRCENVYDPKKLWFCSSLLEGLGS